MAYIKKNKKTRRSWLGRPKGRWAKATLTIIVALLVAAGIYARAAGLPQWAAHVPGAREAAGLIGAEVQGSGEFADIAEDSTDIFHNEEALRAYVKKYGPDRTTRHLHELSAQFGSCHNTAHKAGRFSYEVYGEKAFQECSAECHSGCYHGATEAYFIDNGTADLVENLNVICSTELNPFFSHQCLHGIGHGLMAWTSYELHEALKSCDILERGQESCYTGVFMENIVGGLEDEATESDKEALAGHFTKYLSADPQYPCTDRTLEEKYKGSCYFLQTSRMLQLANGDFQKVAANCLAAPDEYRRLCFQSMGRDAGGSFQKNPTGAISACSHAPKGEYRVDCIKGASQDTFWDATGQGAAVTFCTLLTDKAEKTACYMTIIDRAPDVLSNEQALEAFCGVVETPYQAVCREATRGVAR